MCLTAITAVASLAMGAMQRKAQKKAAQRQQQAIARQAEEARQAAERRRVEQEQRLAAMRAESERRATELETKRAQALADKEAALASVPENPLLILKKSDYKSGGGMSKLQVPSRVAPYAAVGLGGAGATGVNVPP